MRKIIGITIIFWVSILGTCLVANAQNSTRNISEKIHGQWGGATTFHGNDDYWTLNIDAIDSIATFSTVLFRIEFGPAHWKTENNRLIVWMNDEAHRLVITLNILNDGRTLEGSFTQFGQTTPLTLSRISDNPEKGEHTINGRPLISYEERIQHLRDFPDFANNGEVIPFFYDLNRRDLYADLIERFNLDSITAGYSDVELMMVLLNWVCDNFLHAGGSGMPHERNAFAIIDFLDNNPSGGNCRLLAILLAEVLRLYGIEAKHITVHPKEPDGFVHLVTHAYSRKLNQWIMLDPTFRLVLKDHDGNFLDLPTLRTIFANGDEVFPNENAGINNQPFHMESWRTFMAEHMFLFSGGTNFTFGSEDGRDGNTWNMLAPIGFENEFVTTYYFVTTHCANAFWATP